MKTTNRAGMNACLCAGLLILSAARLNAGAVPRSAKPAGVAAGPSQPRIAVRGGDIVLKVPDFQAARSRVLRLAKQYRAELRDARTQVNLSGQKHGEVTLQVDAGSLDELLNNLREVGKLFSERVQTTDQTSYYNKLGRRIALLHQNEVELLGFLRRQQQMRGSDVLYAQYRLFQTRVEASDATQDHLDMERASRQGQLHVVLFEPEAKQTVDWRNWRAHAVYRARGSFLYAARKLVTGAYFVAWFAPFWIPGCVLLWLVVRWAKPRVVRWTARPPTPTDRHQ